MLRNVLFFIVMAIGGIAIFGYIRLVYGPADWSKLDPKSRAAYKSTMRFIACIYLIPLIGAILYFNGWFNNYEGRVFNFKIHIPDYANVYEVRKQPTETDRHIGEIIVNKYTSARRHEDETKKEIIIYVYQSVQDLKASLSFDPNASLEAIMKLQGYSQTIHPANGRSIEIYYPDLSTVAQTTDGPFVFALITGEQTFFLRFQLRSSDPKDPRILEYIDSFKAD